MSATILANEIRRRLGPVSTLPSLPLISIVVVNRDGVDHLRRLMAGLTERTDYPHLELILVDNGSSDDSLEFIRSVEATFPISVIANPSNESFSNANNQGAELASAELLLFLNNDIEPFEPGWLRELVACLQGTGAGAVSSTLICPDSEHECDFEHGYGVQHRGLRFAETGDGDDRLHPVLSGWEADPLDEALGEDAVCEAVASAAMLIAKETFEALGRFHSGYFYGCEDVDLCLKLRSAGSQAICSGRSVLIHYPVSTRRQQSFEQAREIKLANRRLLWERWGPRLRPERRPPA